MSLKVGSLLKTSWQIFMGHWRTVMFIVLLVYLPIDLVMELTPLAGKTDDINNMMTLVRFQSFYELLVGAFAYILIAYLVQAHLAGQPTDFKSLWSKRFSGTVYVRYIWTMLVSGLLNGLLFLALIVPGIIFGVYWALAGFVSIYEDVGGMKAMQISKTMVKGRWWRVLWIVTAGAMCFVGISLAAAMGLSMSYEHWSTSLAGDIIVDIGGGVYIIYLAVAYAALRSTVPQATVQTK